MRRSTAMVITAIAGVLAGVLVFLGVGLFAEVSHEADCRRTFVNGSHRGRQQLVGGPVEILNLQIPVRHLIHHFIQLDNLVYLLLRIGTVPPAYLEPCRIQCGPL